MINKPTILVNGYFLCRRLTGIERYALEITARLDVLCEPGEIAMLVPSDTVDIPRYENILVIRHGKTIQHFFWQMITVQFYLLTHRQYIILDFGNTCLPLAPGIVFLHDIYCKMFPGDFTELRDKLVYWYNNWQYRLIARKAKKIITVSCFSKKQIAQAYGIDPDGISVIHNGWEHMKNIVPDYSIFESYPLLTEKNYFFALGSLSRRKNLAWIIDYAAKHPETIFAVSGTALPTTPDRNLHEGAEYKNIILLGYVDDGKVRALMENSKAFIMPSYYEGFGIPPLEALSCGVPVIVAKAASLPEIYGNTVHYIDPFNINVNLDELLREEISPPDGVLAKYTYDGAAEKLYGLLRDAE